MSVVYLYPTVACISESESVLSDIFVFPIGNKPTIFNLRIKCIERGLFESYTTDDEPANSLTADFRNFRIFSYSLGRV